ncbi:MAG TPA: hypothetical protein VLV86_12025, partial [Vicinamibacterales bacterium]|nr:hypothetical protein [Vicinamibacterales bacterium]
ETTTMALTASMTQNNQWTFAARLYAGSTTSVHVGGAQFVMTGTASTGAVTVYSAGSTAGQVDSASTTISSSAQAFDVQAKFSSSSSSNVIHCERFEIMQA